MKLKLVSTALAAAILFTPYQARPEPQPKVAVILYCACVVVTIVVAGVTIYYVKKWCDKNLGSYSNRVDSVSFRAMPPLVSGAIGNGVSTIQMADSPGQPWVDGYSFDVQQANGQITVVAYLKGTAMATNVSMVYSNGQVVIADFRGILPDTNHASHAIFRLVN